MKEQEGGKEFWAFGVEGVVGVTVDVYFCSLGESRTVFQSNNIAGKWIKIIKDLKKKSHTSIVFVLKAILYVIKFLLYS